MNRDHYRGAAEGWARGASLVYAPIADSLIARTPVPLTGARVLDVGAGTGASEAPLAAAGAGLVVGADLSYDMLAWGRGGRPPAVVADVTRREDIERMLDEAYRRWGRLDVLFNNAGVIRVQPLLDVTEEEWDRVMAVNLRAVFFVLQAAARRMLRQGPMAGSELRGKLVQTASIASNQPSGGTTYPPSPWIGSTTIAATSSGGEIVSSTCSSSERLPSTVMTR